MSNGRVCVVGAGIIGSWAALHLAEAGIETVLLEQFPLPHTRGSSHGASRAFRFLGEETMDRLDYSLERWNALAKERSTELYRRTGLLNFGPRDDEWLLRHMRILDEAARPCEWFDAAAIRKRFPMLRYADDWGAAWDPGGGILFAHRCLHAVQARFEACGGTIVHACAESVEDAGGRATVKIRPATAGAGESLDCDRVVVTCGPWTSRLLPELARLLETVAIPVTYWRDTNGQYNATAGFPILYNARLTDIYALPACEYPNLVKVLYHGGPQADPDARERADRRPFVEKVSAYVKQHLHGLDHRAPAIEETCMYTITPDNTPIIDRASASVVVGAGFSGSGFKHSPASGQMLAALALDEAAALPVGYQLEQYRVDRFKAG